MGAKELKDDSFMTINISNQKNVEYCRMIDYRFQNNSKKLSIEVLREASEVEIKAINDLLDINHDVEMSLGYLIAQKTQFERLKELLILISKPKKVNVNDRDFEIFKEKAILNNTIGECLNSIYSNIEYTKKMYCKYYSEQKLNNDYAQASKNYPLFTLAKQMRNVLIHNHHCFQTYNTHRSREVGQNLVCREYNVNLKSLLETKVKIKKAEKIITNLKEDELWWNHVKVLTFIHQYLELSKDFTFLLLDDTRKIMNERIRSIKKMKEDIDIEFQLSLQVNSNKNNEDERFMDIIFIEENVRMIANLLDKQSLKEQIW